MSDGAGARARGGRVGGPVWPSVLTALLCALAGGSAGFFLTRPIYRSTAELTYLGDGPDLELLEFAVRSTPCVEMAQQDSVWVALGRPVTPRTTDQFRGSIGVNRVSKIAATVTFDDPDPKAAQASLVALVKAWQKETQGSKIEANNQRMSLLAERVSSLTLDLAAKKDRIRAITDPSEAFDDDDVWRARNDELMRLKRLVDDAEIAELTRSAATRPATVPAGLAALKERYQRESLELLRLRRLRTLLNDLRAEAAELQRQVTSSKAEIDRLNLELRLSNDFVRVLSDGNLPGTPAIDARPRRAALGAVAGLAVFALFGLARRFRGRRAKSLRGAFPVVIPETDGTAAPVAAERLQGY